MTATIAASAAAQFFFPTAGASVFFPEATQCLVALHTQINTAAANNTIGPNLRVGVDRAGVFSFDSGGGTFYFARMAAAGESPMTVRIGTVTAKALQTTRFRCYLSGADADWQGDTVDCAVTYLCY